MAQGWTSHQIARELNVSTQTIRNWTERYPIDVTIDEDSSKRIYDEGALQQLSKINYLKDNIHELIKKELIAATPTYEELNEDRKRLIEEVRKWKRAQGNLLMNNEILLQQKREIEENIEKKNRIISQLLKERDLFKEKMKELTDICEELHQKAIDYQERWGNEQKKSLFQILRERGLIVFHRNLYSVKEQKGDND